MFKPQDHPGRGNLRRNARPALLTRLGVRQGGAIHICREGMEEAEEDDEDGGVGEGAGGKGLRTRRGGIT
eukprot:6682673-Pyramimonas_sp.AAC.1